VKGSFICSFDGQFCGRLASAVDNPVANALAKCPESLGSAVVSPLLRLARMRSPSTRADRWAAVLIGFATLLLVAIMRRLTGGIIN
jgi:hypothetical protein